MCDEIGQGSLKGVGTTGIFGGKVPRFPRIDLVVVELAARRANELVAPVAHGRELAPPVVVAGIEALAVGEELQPLAGERRRKILTLHLGVGGDADQRENRRHDIDNAYLVVDDSRRHARSGHDQRNVRRRLIDEESVRLFLVLSERLTVIADDDDEGVVEAAISLERAEETSELDIGVCDLGVVSS